MTLIVGIGGDRTTVREMVEEADVGYVAEMIDDPAKLDQWNPGWSAKGAALATASEDDKPHFVVMRVEEGWSRNRRLYDGEEIRSIAEQTNKLEPVGHLGHIPEDQASTALPDPQTTWFAATTKQEPSKQKGQEGQMVTTGYFAGYNLPGAKIRTYLRARAVRGFSWAGSCSQIPVPGKGVQVKGLVLDALDWARKGTEGMPTARVVATVTEMEDGKMDKALSQVTPEEFERENPNGYALLVAKATAAKDTTITEMQSKVTEGETAKTLLQKACELLGIDKPEDIETKITELKDKIGGRAKATLSAGLDAILAEKVPGDSDDAKAKRALVRRLLPVTEMEAKVAGADEDNAKTVITEMVTEAFDKDDTIKGVIGTTQPPAIRRREELRSGSNDLSAVGMTRTRVQA